MDGRLSREFYCQMTFRRSSKSLLVHIYLEKLFNKTFKSYFIYESFYEVRLGPSYRRKTLIKYFIHGSPSRVFYGKNIYR